MIYSKKVLDLDIKLNNHYFILTDYTLIGDIFFEMGQLDSALAMFKKSEKIVLEGKNLSFSQKNETTTLTALNIGAVYFEQGYTKKSLPYLNKGLALSKRHNQKNYIGMAHHSLFRFYEKEKKETILDQNLLENVLDLGVFYLLGNHIRQVSVLLIHLVH